MLCDSSLLQVRRGLREGLPQLTRAVEEVAYKPACCRLENIIASQPEVQDLPFTLRKFLVQEYPTARKGRGGRVDAVGFKVRKERVGAMSL